MNKFFSFCLLGFMVCSCQEDFDHRLQREAKTYTELHCPYNEADGTVLDSMSYNPSSQTLVHWYSLQSAFDVPQVYNGLINNQETAKQAIVERLRGNTQWESCKERQINFDYVYSSKAAGKTLFRIKVTPKDYQR